MDTQQEQSVETVPNTSLKADFPRDTKMCLVEIDCAPTSALLPNGVILEKGIKRYYIREMDLPVAERMVYTDEDKQQYAAAAEQYERDIAHTLSVDKVLLETRDQPLENERRMREILDSDPRSVEGTITRLYPNSTRGFRCLNSLRVIEKGLVNPSDLARVAEAKERAQFEREARSEEAAAAASAVATAVAQALAPLVVALQSPSSKKGG